MTQRNSPGICLLLLLSLAFPTQASAAGAPRNVNDFALAYRVQVYETFRMERDEYIRRIEAGKDAMVRYRSAKSGLDRKRVIDWYHQAILASYPGGGSLPILPGEDIANTFEDAGAIVARDSKFKYNPEFHPLRFNQYSRSPNWETQKPTMPDFGKEGKETPPSKSLASSENTDSSDSADEQTSMAADTARPSSDEIAFDQATDPDPSEAVESFLPKDNPLDLNLDDSDGQTLALEDSVESTTPQKSSLDISAADIDRPKSGLDIASTELDIPDAGTHDQDFASSDVDDAMAASTLDINPETLDLDDNITSDVNKFASSPSDDDSNTNSEDELVPAEIDESTASEAFDTVVNSEVEPEPVVPSISAIEINARVAGHNLALAGLEKRAERAFSGNHKDIENVVTRMEQLFDAHIKARLLIDSAPELESQVIALDNMFHLTGEVNRQLKQFMHSTTDDMDRDTLDSLRTRALVIYESAQEL